MNKSNKKRRLKNAENTQAGGWYGVGALVFGAMRLRTPAKNATALLNLLLESGERYTSFCVDDAGCAEEDGGQYLYASAVLGVVGALRIMDACKRRGIDVDGKLVFGLPRLLVLIFKRPFIVVGLLFSMLLFLLSSSVLWEIRVSGNTQLSVEDIVALLEENGLYVGRRLSSIDVDRVQSEVTRQSEDIAWISVNLSGTVAFVEVIEEERLPKEPHRVGDGVNLLAERGGLIVSLEIIAGEACVETGDTVREGELLVSGLIDSARLGWRALEAKGQVFAQTERQLQVSVPYEYKIVRAQSLKLSEISIIFFSFRQKIFKKGGNEAPKCDTISSELYIYSTDDRRIPIGLEIKKELSSSTAVSVRTKEEAAALGELELSRLIARECKGCEILRKSTSLVENESKSGLTLVCNIVCIEDIANPQPFFVGAGE